jgi:phage terminase large subunit
MPLKINLKTNSCYKPYFNTKYTTNIFFGGSGSGKSVFMAQKVMLDLIKGDRYLVCRKVAATLKYSCYQEIKTAIINAGLQDYFVFNLAPDLKITCIKNGTFALFKGLDDIEKIKSISGLTKIWVEEASETSQNDIDQLRLRLRGSDDIIFQIFLTFNPISDTNWIYKTYFEQLRPEVFILKTTYLDNAFVGKAYAETLEALKKTNQSYYRIYALGEWGKIKTGQEFYKNYDTSNIDKCDYVSDYPLHLSFDFNVVPYVSCLVSQVLEKEDGLQLRILEEITLSSPNNTTTALCQRFKAKYPDCQRVYVYGDPAGNSRDTRSGGTDYTIIMKELADRNPINRVATSAPKLYLRNIFMNKLLAHQTKAKLVIDKNCKLLIKDLEEVIEAADGTKLKKKVRDKATNQSYEEVGHLSDCLDYLCCRVFESEFLSLQGKKIGYSLA